MNGGNCTGGSEVFVGVSKDNLGCSETWEIDVASSSTADGKRLIFREGGDLYLLDRRGGEAQKIYSLKQPNQVGSHALSRDNRRLYFTDTSSEADIWLLNLK